MHIIIYILFTIVMYFLSVCSNAFWANSGSFKTPGYPSDYPTSMQCLYNITAPSGSIITIHFVSFYLEPQSSCSYDSMQVSEKNYSLLLSQGQHFLLIYYCKRRYFRAAKFLSSDDFGRLIFVYVALNYI